MCIFGNRLLNHLSIKRKINILQSFAVADVGKEQYSAKLCIHFGRKAKLNMI
jgi:hypothetical protein